MTEENRQPFARQTKQGGVVACLDFDSCYTKAEGAGCVDCKRNTYSKTKKNDNFVSRIISSVKLPSGTVQVDHVVGVCDFGNVRVILAPDWKNCAVFLNGKPCRDIVGFQIMAGSTMLTQCHLAVLKPEKTTGVESDGQPGTGILERES